jgi:1,5-anhydro-D-fructose reductase (1,5-anhydro-D-mannitol-forming)
MIQITILERIKIKTANMTEQKYKCGIIGFGKMGRIRAAAIEKTGVAEIVAIYEPSLTGFTKYTNLDSPAAVLEAGISAVFICTPNYIIKSLTIAALEKGIHVFSEKPPGISLAETREMHEMVLRNNDFVLMFGFNHRHHGSVVKMKNIIESGTMGKVLWMRGRYGKEVNESFFNGWRVKKELSGGGIMLDQGIHMLDLFLYLGGEFDEVKAFVSNLYWKIEGIEDNVFAIFRNNNTGLCASLHSTMTQWRYIFSLEIFLENGSLILNGLKTSSGAYGDESLTIKYNTKPSYSGAFGKEEEIVYHFDTSWDSETIHFFDCIEKKRQPNFGNSYDAMVLMSLMEKIYNN